MSSLPSTNGQSVLVMLGGSSGIGKTTAINRLIAEYPDAYARPISFTTRSRRDHEVNGPTEYEFVSRAEIKDLHRRGALITLDEAYGQFYGISRHSVDVLVSQGIIPIKEIHPKNHAALRAAFPCSISVLLESPRDATISTLSGKRDLQDRERTDRDFYTGLETQEFDLIHKVTIGDVLDTAKGLHRALRSFLALREMYPSPREIDSLNRTGYDIVAREFDDSQRVTTRNFHSISLEFLKRTIERYVHNASECLEVGPGNGWLRSAIKWPNARYRSVDISKEMNPDSADPHDRTTSVRCLPYTSRQFDVAVASLADPFLFPSAISEVCRILKVGGYFILTTPTHTWSGAVRKKGSENKTVFTLKNGVEVCVYSFAPTEDHARTLFDLCDFAVVEHVVLNGSHLPSEEPVSQALSTAALSLGLPLAELPILNAFVLRRRQ